MKEQTTLPATPQTKAENNRNVLGDMVMNTLDRVFKGGKLNLAEIVKIAKEEVNEKFEQLQIGDTSKIDESKKLTDGNNNS